MRYIKGTCILALFFYHEMHYIEPKDDILPKIFKLKKHMQTTRRFEFLRFNETQDFYYQY